MPIADNAVHREHPDIVQVQQNGGHAKTHQAQRSRISQLSVAHKSSKIIINMVKWLNPRQFLTGRGIIMGGIDAVYDLTGVKLKIFILPLDGCRCDPIL